MRVKELLFILFLLFPVFFAFGQRGIVRGSVFDGRTGENLPGVTIFVEGTTWGTITDLDGKFSLSLMAGTYQFRISFISYETIFISDVVVKADEVTLLDDLKLNEATIELGEAVVTASYIRDTENAMLTMRRKSGNVLDGISSAALKRTGDSDAAASIKRVPGVSVENNKYVFVRGLGDRYTKTVLNGLDIPGLDPDRNTLQLDIFPTNIVDNLVVNKSFSADLPADFTGGVVNINLKDFPDSKEGGVSLDAGYNPQAHFHHGFLSYKGGKTDWLGFDDGTRAIPATEDIPLFSEVVGQPQSEKGLRFKGILKSFTPVLAATPRMSFMDFSLGTSWGNQIQKGKYTLGYVLSLSYKNTTDLYTDAFYGRYGLSGDARITEMELREHQMGRYGVNNVLVSGLTGLAVKTKNARYRLNLLHLQSGESQAGVFNYAKSNQGTEFSGFQHNLEYSQRSLSNAMLDGKNNFRESDWEMNWKFSPTLSRIDDPDIRFTRYEDRGDSFSIGTEVGFPERIWRELREVNLAGVLHLTKEMKMFGKDAKLKFGGAYTWKERDFIIRNFALNIRNIPLTGDPNELFMNENLWPYNGNVGRGTTYEAPFIPVNPNQYNSVVNNMAGYVSIEVNLTQSLKTIAGIRLENYFQHYTGRDQLGQNILDQDQVLKTVDFFPTIQFIHSATENQNLRFSYAKTIARPSFKELSYAEIFDPISGQTFIGGLFRDANDFVGEEYWDGNLTSTSINNFDFRWELFQSNGQSISAGLFYKLFGRPIEMVQFATQAGSYQPRNVGDGQVIGAEFEFRQSLQILGESFKWFSINGNITYIRSRIELSSTEYKSRTENARTGQSVNQYRDMAGQAPYIVNLGIAYNGRDNDFWKGLEAGLYYHVQGQTLQLVGMVDRPDIYSEPFHSLNFNSGKSFGKKQKFQVGLKIDNLLNDEKKSVFKSFHATNQLFSKLSPGTTFQFKLGYNF
ncbi:MAG: TonB-dependent receptor [Mariniphaga sp.]|nr:TonB-dependent receptor [Mariniphaga sp.]